MIVYAIIGSMFLFFLANTVIPEWKRSREFSKRERRRELMRAAEHKTRKRIIKVCENPVDIVAIQYIFNCAHYDDIYPRVAKGVHKRLYAAKRRQTQ